MGAHPQPIAARASGKQIGAGLREAYESTALVQHQPTVCDRVIEAGVVSPGLARGGFTKGANPLPCL
jgi:hypothetical protein